MSRITTAFQKLNGRKALIPYITAGDPNLETTLETIHEMAANGADIIELGIPFSDPMADGPVIQRAAERALANGVSLKNVLETVRRFRERDNDTPVVLMGYHDDAAGDASAAARLCLSCADLSNPAANPA